MNISVYIYIYTYRLIAALKIFPYIYIFSSYCHHIPYPSHVVASLIAAPRTRHPSPDSVQRGDSSRQSPTRSVKVEPRKKKKHEFLRVKCGFSRQKHGNVTSKNVDFTCKNVECNQQQCGIYRQKKWEVNQHVDFAGNILDVANQKMRQKHRQKYAKRSSRNLEFHQQTLAWISPISPAKLWNEQATLWN